MCEPGARRSPASTERVSVASPPALSVATVWMRVAPAEMWTVALNVPSELITARVALMVTLATGGPGGMRRDRAGDDDVARAILDQAALRRRHPQQGWIRLRAELASRRDDG